MRIFDEVLDDISKYITQYEPERGGILFGPDGRDVIALFVPDERAETSSASYTISKEMCDIAPRIEQETNLEYKGVVHSHCGTFDHPSHGDGISAANALRLNPHLGRFFMPIVTVVIDKNHELQDHELLMLNGKLSAFYATRCDNPEVECRISNVPLFNIPLRECLNKACQMFLSSGIAKRFTISKRASRVFSYDGALNFAYTLEIDSHEYIVMAGELFDQYAPHIMKTDMNGNTRSVPINWTIDCRPENRIFMAIKQTLQKKEYRVKFSRSSIRNKNALLDKSNDLIHGRQNLRNSQRYERRNRRGRRVTHAK